MGTDLGNILGANLVAEAGDLAYGAHLVQCRLCDRQN